MLVQETDISIAPQHPNQFIDDRFEVQLLGGQQGETGLQVEAHLVAKDRARAGAGPVPPLDAMLEDITHQI